MTMLLSLLLSLLSLSSCVSSSADYYSNATLTLALSAQTKSLSVRPGSSVRLRFNLSNRGTAGWFAVSQVAGRGVGEGQLSETRVRLGRGISWVRTSRGICVRRSSWRSCSPHQWSPKGGP